MAYFYLSNRVTLSSFLSENLEAPAALAHWQGFVVDAVQRTGARTRVSGPKPDRQACDWRPARRRLKKPGK